MLRASTTDHPSHPPAEAMLRPSLRVLISPLVLLAVTAACSGGGDDSESEVKAKVATQLVESGLDEQQADCFAGVIVDELGADAVNDIDFSADQPPAGQEEAFAQAALKALSECDLDLDSLDG